MTPSDRLAQYEAEIAEHERMIERDKEARRKLDLAIEVNFRRMINVIDKRDKLLQRSKG